MPVAQMAISNLSGKVIPRGHGVRVRIMWPGERATDPARRNDMRIDLTEKEAEQLIKQYNAEEVEIRPERRGKKEQTVEGTSYRRRAT